MHKFPWCVALTQARATATIASAARHVMNILKCNIKTVYSKCLYV